MHCSSHEIFFSTCGHIFRCSSPHTAPPGHACNKYLPRTLSSADASPIGIATFCSVCNGGPKLPDEFILQNYSEKDKWEDWDWDGEIMKMRDYYSNSVHSDTMLEKLLAHELGSNWDEAGDGLYIWEKEMGRTRSCREKSETEEESGYDAKVADEMEEDARREEQEWLKH
jgi:hypothetical protein